MRVSTRARTWSAVAAVVATTGSSVLMIAQPADATPAYAVTATITTGAQPQALSVDRTTDTIYVAAGADNTVSVIDGATNTVTATVPVGASPTGVGIDEATDTIYVPNAGAGTLSVIDGATNTVTATLSVGIEPWAVAVDETTDTIYVPDVVGGAVSVIDGATNTVIATLPVGIDPLAVTVDETTDTIYVPNYGDDTVTVIDGSTNTVTATLPVGTQPQSIAVDEATDTIYVSNFGDDTVSVIDGSTNAVTATVPVGINPGALAVDEATHMIYVPNQGERTLSVIDGASSTVTATLLVGNNPYAAMVDEARHVVYETNPGDNTVSVIDDTTNAVIATMSIHGPDAIAVNQTTGKAYVVNIADSSTSVIDHTEAATTTTLAAGPSQVTGVPVTLTATIVPAPTDGTATFTDGGNPIAGCGALPVDATTGVATCMVTFPSAGGQTVAATYTGGTGFAASAAAPLTFTVAAPAPMIGHAMPVVTRIAGPDRYATAAAASIAEFPTGGAGAVVLVTGTNYPDALVGAPLAAAKNAPLLLTTGTALPAVTVAEIARVLPTGRTVYVIGSNAAVPISVTNQLTALGYNVNRIAGPDRYTTAVKVADALGDPTTVLLASGLTYPDSVAAGPAAAHIHGVMLLTDGTILGAATTSYLAAHPGTTYAVGGAAAAADSAATALAGANRYATAAAVAGRFFPAPTRIGVVTGGSFGGALSGGALVTGNDGLILLADPDHTSDATNYLTHININTCWLFGDTNTLPTTVADTITTALTR